MKKFTTRAIEMASDVLLCKPCFNVLIETSQHLVHDWSYIILELLDSQTYLLIWGDTNSTINPSDMTIYQNEDDAFRAMFKAIHPNLTIL